MFAVVRTGGKQYRVALGDRIVVERLDGAAGDRIELGEVLLAGEGSDLKSTSGLTVAAEIVAQAKGDKVTVFKKRRRHNYRRKQGHRQQHTILRIVAIGDQKEERKPTPKGEQKPEPKPEPKAAAPAASPAGDAGQPTPNPAPDDHKAAGADKAPDKAPAKASPAAKPAAKAATKPAAKATPKTDSPKPAPAKAKAPSTKNAAPAKGAAKKSPKAK